MTRPIFSIAGRKPKAGPSYALVRKAARMFKGSYGPRELRHKNIKNWIRAVEVLGDKHVLSPAKPPAKWGVPMANRGK